MAREIDFRQQAEQLIRVGLALSSERDLSALLELIVDQSRGFTDADGGTLYFVREDLNHLSFEVLQNNSLKVRLGGRSGGRITYPPVPLSVDGQPNLANVCAYAANTGETVNIADVYRAEGFDFSGTRRYDAQTGYRCQSMLVIPMRNHEDEIIGVLQLINALHPDSRAVIPFDPDYVDLTSSLASMAAVGITNVRLIRDLENLFESFIQAIAGAIDEKSKYSGRHVRRVSELAMAIASQVNETRSGPLAYVRMTPDEMNELRIAAWLHDVGKITTPEYVVDKARKLETIYDRIGLVRTRFELAEREAEVRALRRKLELASSGKAPAEEMERIDLEAGDRIRALREDYAFLAECNMGGEVMADEKVARVQEIASAATRVGAGSEPLLTEDEAYNLSIRKGTLTPEEMARMRNHAAVSNKMLSQLPFSRKLRRVPEYAGGHHEALNGKGYPKGLTAEQLPFQARIMAIADIFEALTAHDRPYKKAMPLSQSLKILGFMVKDGHLDPDLVELCVREGVFMEYAKRELRPDQLDVP